MTASATVRIDRMPGWPWFRLQPFTVELDGSNVEKIRHGKSIALSIPSGEHRVRIRFRTLVWSDPFVVTLTDGEECLLECDTDWQGYPWLARKR